jgi:hypothetical protein
MRSEILDLLTTIGTAKAKGVSVAEIVERFAVANGISLDGLGPRRRKSIFNKLDAAAMSLAASIARGAAALNDAPRSHDEDWPNV